MNTFMGLVQSHLVWIKEPNPWKAFTRTQSIVVYEHVNKINNK